MEIQVTSRQEIERCLKPTPFMDHDNPTIRNFAKQVIGDAGSDIDKAIRLFYAVRDDIQYDPYGVDLTPEGFRASIVLARKKGYCVVKAVLLAALARAVSIPSRIGLADVRNHLVTERLRRLMKTDIFYYHGFTELFLDGQWVKATPTFNLSLCQRFGIKPMDFDGRHDALFHEFDRNGKRHMEYVKYHGSFADLPFDRILNAFDTYYPTFIDDCTLLGLCNFEKEAEEDING